MATVSYTLTNTNGNEWRSWSAGTSSSTTASAWRSWVEATNSTVATFSSTVEGTVVAWRQWNEAVEEVTRTFTDVQHVVDYREREAQAVEFKRQQDEASQKANDLLMMHLNEQQRRSWREQKHFELYSQSGKRFRIKNGYSMNVDELDADGRVVRQHCIVPSGVSVPLPDQLLAQKLMLEHHEEDFMRIANHR